MMMRPQTKRRTPANGSNGETKQIVKSEETRKSIDLFLFPWCSSRRMGPLCVCVCATGAPLTRLNWTPAERSLGARAPISAAIVAWRSHTMINCFYLAARRAVRPVIERHAKPHGNDMAMQMASGGRSASRTHRRQPAGISLRCGLLCMVVAPRNGNVMMAPVLKCSSHISARAKLK